MINARGNVVMRYKHNMIGPDEDEEEDESDEEEGPDSHQIYQNSMDGGERGSSSTGRQSHLRLGQPGTSSPHKV